MSPIKIEDKVIISDKDVFIQTTALWKELIDKARTAGVLQFVESSITGKMISLAPISWLRKNGPGEEDFLHDLNKLERAFDHDNSKGQMVGTPLE